MDKNLKTKNHKIIKIFQREKFENVRSEKFVNDLKEKNIKIVEDAAHALPTTCHGKLIGSLDTDVCVFSFYANKHITTGEGGMIATNNKLLSKKFLILRNL